MNPARVPQAPYSIAPDAMMERRAFIGVITGGLLAAPLAGEAQQAGKMYRIGLCHVGLDHEPPSLPTLKQALAHPGVGGGRL